MGKAVWVVNNARNLLSHLFIFPSFLPSQSRAIYVREKGNKVVSVGGGILEIWWENVLHFYSIK